MVSQHSSVGNPYIGINLLCHANVGIYVMDGTLLEYGLHDKTIATMP